MENSLALNRSIHSCMFFFASFYNGKLPGIFKISIQREVYRVLALYWQILKVMKNIKKK